MSEFKLTAKRAVYLDASEYVNKEEYKQDPKEQEMFTRLDVIYRALCAVLYNYAPLSGHPGGSISCGRLIENLIYNNLNYDFSDPHRQGADILSYAAGHKALGLYAMWALRNECVAQAEPGLLPKNIADQMRLEDLLGFRRNSATDTPLFKKFSVKPLGGHPEPLVPFVKTSTGASGVGVCSAVGMAFGAAAAYKDKAPKINILEGEGGMSAGRVNEALASAATACINNVVLHLDWNEASIDSNQVTAEDGKRGDYVQWTPVELLHINDWNVIFVPSGHDFNQIYAAQKLAAEMNNTQPTAIVYRTVKGWHYGLEGKSSHGSGHKFDSEGFYNTLKEFETTFGLEMPRFCGAAGNPGDVEKCYWDTLLTVREALAKNKDLAKFFADKTKAAAENLKNLGRTKDNSDVEKIYSFNPKDVPAEFNFEPGKPYTTRGVLGDVLGHINKQSGGAVLTSSADLYGSTNASNIAKDFDKGFYNKASNPGSKLLATGGICEDAMNGIVTGVSAFGAGIGVSSSYAAFLAFGHVAMRMHAIGQEAHHTATGKPFNTVIMYNAHASLPTGEDGPTHADPQALQLMQDNFPKGVSISITPFEVDEIWPLVTHSLSKRPAVFSPFVIRPSDKFIDRAALGLAPAQDAIKGVYSLSKADGKEDGNIIVQGSGAARFFVTQVLPELKKQGLKINAWYVTSKELFEMLPATEQEAILPAEKLKTTMGITDYTLPTLEGWLHSRKGKEHSIYPFKKGKYLGSAKSDKVYEEAGMDAKGQISAILSYIKELKNDKNWQ